MNRVIHNGRHWISAGCCIRQLSSGWRNRNYDETQGNRLPPIDSEGRRLANLMNQKGPEKVIETLKSLVILEFENNQMLIAMHSGPNKAIRAQYSSLKEPKKKFFTVPESCSIYINPKDLEAD